jgi:hypothetical protein
MKQSILYYSFITIFIITALTTLLGIVNVIQIDGFYLKSLMGAFLVETAAALVAVFKKTDFFDKKSPSSTMGLTENMVGRFDRLSDEIEAAINNQPLPSSNRPHHFIMLRIGNAIATYSKMQEFNEEYFEKLPDGTKRQIKTYNASMDKLENEWHKIKQSGANSMTDPRTRERQLSLIKDMKNDLVGVVDTLQTAGFWLNDHYLTVQSLIMQLKG